MGGVFGVAAKYDCVTELFFGVDYHSHLGTRRGGMAVTGTDGFQRAIHNIENSPFRTKFEKDVNEMKGCMGIGCISDSEPQPLIIRSHLGSYAITTVGRINNLDELVEDTFKNGCSHFQEMSNDKINATELVAAIINQCDSIPEGIRHAQEVIDGSMTLLIVTKDGIYAARDLNGRTPLILGVKEDAICVAFESFSFINLGYKYEKDLGPGEIVFFDSKKYETVMEPRKEMKICAFLWTYYGYPTSCYEGVNVETMRYRCGQSLAKRDSGIDIDYVAGVPDSGTAHAIGYANESGIQFSRPFIKYTPTWPRSFTPPKQSMRSLIAKMKLIPVEALIKDKNLLFIDDSVVRGTQMSETVQLLYKSGAKDVHIRSACPPIMFGCKYLNFSRSSSELELITRRVIRDFDGDDRYLSDYLDDSTERYQAMVDEIGKRLKFTSMKYHLLDDIIDAVGMEGCKLCTYCWNGKE